MTDGGLTLGERIKNIEDSLASIRDSMQLLAVRDSADDQRLKALDARLTKVEGWQTWALRIVVGAVVAGALAAIGYIA